MRFFKKFILISFGLLVFIIFSLITFLKLYENEIYGYILYKINKQTNIDISCKETKLSLLQYFPNVAISFNTVKINFNHKFIPIKNDSIKPNDLLSADQIIIKISLFSLLKNPVIIKGIEIRNGSILAMENFNGDRNYILKNALSKNSRELVFQLENLILSDITFKYLNEKEKLYIHLNINNSYIRGTLQNQNLNFNTHSLLNKIFILSNGFKYNTNNNSNISFHFSSSPEIISLANGTLLFNNESFKFRGNYQLSKPYKYDITFYSSSIKATNIQNFGIHIPKQITILTGYYSLYLNIYGNNNSPIYFYVSTSIKKLSFKYKTYKLKNIRCKLNSKGQYTDRINSNITCQDLNGDLFNSTFNISKLTYCNLNDSLNGIGTLNIKCSDMNNFLSDSIINFASGEIHLSFTYKARVYSDFKNYLTEILNNSQISVANTKFTIYKNIYSFVNLNSDIISKGNKLNIYNFEAIINNNYIKFSGCAVDNESLIKNYFSKFSLTGNLSGRFLNLNNIITNNKSLSNSNSTIFINPQIHINVNASFDTLIFKSFRFDGYHSQFSFSDNLLLFSNIDATFCEGRIHNGTLHVKVDKNSISLSSNCNFNSINIETLFTKFFDFGQKEITSKNIKGKLTGDAFCKVLWENNLFSKDAFTGQINFELINGELNGFRPIYKLSKFIDLSELNRIKFKKITTKISVFNKTIIIPYVNLKNSAINLGLSGSHSLDNEYEYHFKVILSDLLNRKKSFNKKKENEYFQTEEDTLRIIYLKLKGDSIAYKFSYDGKQTMKAFSEKIKIEKNQIKKIFNEEFGLYKKDSTLKHDSYKHSNKSVIESEDIAKDKISSDTNKGIKKEKKKTKIEWKDE
jgi:hypothetical protein